MPKKAIRLLFIPAAALLILGMVFGPLIIRILCITGLIYLGIFIVGRIGSKKTKEKTEPEKTPDEDVRQKNSSRSTENIVDGKWREIDPEEPREEAPHEEETHEEEPQKEAGSLSANIQTISKAADGIRDQQAREKAFHVLILAKDIIREHEEENNKCRSFRQFENYYIPTLKSVITNYRAMEIKGMANAQMQEDFMEYLKKCDEAFTNIYNSMFNDDILEMEVQMEAMNIILKRDGLL